MGGGIASMGSSAGTCVYVPDWSSMPADQAVATAANAAIAAISILSLLYYFYHYCYTTCGWEEVYVCGIELFKVFVEIFLESCSPVSFREADGSLVLWVRYAEWLLTCPVILMHLSNLTGLANDYSHRTMALLVSDIGTIVMGVTAAISTSRYVKLAFFLLGLVYGSMTFMHAGAIHMEAFYAMPQGACRRLVKWMAVVFFASWTGYPLLFMLGHEGFFGVLSPWASAAAHCLVDVLSKNVWGFLGHHLRIKVHEFIILHGMVRARRSHKVLGGLWELEVETLVVDESASGAVRCSVAGMTNRKSFQNMTRNMARKGKVARASFTDSSQPGSTAGGVADTAAPGPHFLMGSPVWRSSLAGHKVHPAATGSRFSLDWPGLGGGLAPASQHAEAPRPEGGKPARGPGAAAAEPGAAQPPAGDHDGDDGGDAVASLAVRARARVEDEDSLSEGKQS